MANKDKAILSKKLVTLKDDVPIKDDPSSFVLQEIKKDKLYDFLREMEFNKLLSRAISFYGETENKKNQITNSKITSPVITMSSQKIGSISKTFGIGKTSRPQRALATPLRT